MTLYVDFCLRLAGRLVLVGWGEGRALVPPYAVHDADGRPLSAGPPAVLRFLRPDLSGPAADLGGFVLVFPDTGSAPAGADASGGAPVALHAGAAAFPAALGEGLDGFVALAPGEAVVAVLFAIGRGLIPPPDGAAAASLFARARAERAPSSLETPAFAAALDLVAADPAVAALVASGWVLPAAGADATPALLALSPARIVPLEAAFDAIARPDLAGYAGRYAAERPAGFAAAAALPPAPAEPPAAMLLVASGGRILAASRAADVVPFAALARRLAGWSPHLPAATRARLRGVFGAALATPAPRAAPAVAAAAAGPPLLVLEHDGRPRDLRVVLPLLGRAGIDRVVLDGPAPGGEVDNAVAGARRDEPRSPALLPPRDLFAAADAGRAVVFAPSSVLLQHDVLPFLLAEADAGGGRLAVWDPAGRPPRGDTAAALVADVARRVLPFALALGPAAAAGLRTTGPFLTVAARLLFALGAVPRERLAVRVLTGTHFVGEAAAAVPPSAVAAERLLPGRTALEFDLETIAAAVATGDGR